MMFLIAKHFYCSKYPKQLYKSVLRKTVQVTLATSWQKNVNITYQFCLKPIIFY